METRKVTLRNKRVVASVDPFVLAQIDDKRVQLGNCSRACVLRIVLNSWARERASMHDVPTEDPATENLAHVG